MSAIDGNACYTCGRYNTACGCRPHTYPLGGCGGTCTDVSIPSSPVHFAASPSTSTPPPQVTARSKNYGAQSDSFQALVGDTGVRHDQDADAVYVRENDPDSPFRKLPDQGRPSESTAFDDNTVPHDDPVTWAPTATPTRAPTFADVNATHSPTAAYTNSPTRTPTTRAPTQSPTVFEATVELASPQHAVVYATPGHYADVSTLESIGSAGELLTGVRIGTLPFYDHASNSTQCVNGVNPPTCDKASAWAALGATVEGVGAMGVFDRFNARTAWEPADRVPALGYTGPVKEEPIWLRLDFKSLSRVSSARIKWGGNDAVLQAPQQARFELTRYTEYTEYTETGRELVDSYVYTAGCLNTFSRTDTWQLDAPTTASSLWIYPVTPCSQSNSGANPGALYSLSSISVTGSVVVGPPLLPSWTALQNPTLTVPSTGAGIEVWSACNRRDLGPLVDGKRGVDSAPIVLSKKATTSTTSRFAISAEFADSGRYALLHRLVLHSRGPNSPSVDSLTVCPHNTTSSPSPPSGWQPPPGSAAHCATVNTNTTGLDSVDLRSARAELIQSELTKAEAEDTIDVPSWWLNTTGFYTEPHYTTVKGEAGRDKSFVFEFASPVPAQAFTIWFGHEQRDAFRTARATTGATASLELGLDTNIVQSAQWRLNPANVAPCDGNVSPSTIDTTLYPSPTDNTNDNRIVFEAEGTAREWFALEEIDAFVVPSDDTPSTSSASPTRRLLGTVEEEDDAFAAAQRAFQGRRFSWESTQDKTRLMDVLHPYKEGTPFKPSAAPETGRHQPYSDDLSLMPEPSTEPQFDCVVYHRLGTNASSDRMQCFSRHKLQVGHTQDGDTNGAHFDTGAWTAAQEGAATAGPWTRPAAITPMMNTAKLNHRLNELTELQEQQQLLRDVALRRASHAQKPTYDQYDHTAASPPPWAQAPTPAVQPSGSRRLLGSGGFGWLKDWVRDFVAEALEGFTGLICDMMRCLLKPSLPGPGRGRMSCCGCRCGEYCTESRGCYDSSNLGQCFSAFGQFIMEVRCPRTEPPLVSEKRRFTGDFRLLRERGHPGVHHSPDKVDILKALLTWFRDTCSEICSRRCSGYCSRSSTPLVLLWAHWQGKWPI